MSIPVRELAKPCSAKGKREAGKRLPKIPRIMNFFQLGRNVPLKLIIAIGNNARDANTSLIIPTCTGLKASSPRFIKIKELPQIKASTTKRITGKIPALAVFNFFLTIPFIASVKFLSLYPTPHIAN